MKIEEYLEKTGFAFMQVSYKLLFNHVKLIIRFISDVTDSSEFRYLFRFCTDILHFRMKESAKYYQDLLNEKEGVKGRPVRLVIMNI